MYNTLRWFTISTVLLVSVSAIVNYPAKAAFVQKDLPPSNDPSYNLSVDYSENRNESNIESTQPSNHRDVVSIPEPSTLLGLVSFSTLFAFKRKPVTKT